MSDWSGQGLPPAAAARMERARTGTAVASLLSIGGQAGLEGCGLHPVGEVMGCIVEYIGWQGWGGCGYGGYYSGGGYGAGPFGRGPFGGGVGGSQYMGAAQVVAGFAPYVDAMYAGYDTAMLRMLTECQAVGGDGVVGLALTVTRMEGDYREFLAYGTAVRAKSNARPRNLFATTLAGGDVSKLLRSGWAPAGTVVGLSMAIRHDDWATVQQASALAGNNEVGGYTDLVHRVRSDARHQFASRVAAYGAEGSISSDFSLDVWEREIAEGHRDHVALASVIGTAITRFHAGDEAQTKSISVLPLDSTRRDNKR